MRSFALPAPPYHVSYGLIFVDRLNGNRLGHDLIEIVSGHAVQGAVDGVHQSGIALLDGNADVDVLGTLLIGELEVAVGAGEVQNLHVGISSNRRGLAGYRYNSFTTTGAIVRSDWVEKVGMKTSELTTIDDYHDFLAAVKGQGLCEYPMPLRYDTSITGSPFLAAMGGYMGPAAESSPQSFYYDDNDELVYSFITDTYKEYLTLMADWYKEGLITRDLLNSDMLDSSAITSGSYAVFWQDCQFMSMWTEAGKVDDPDYALAGISEPLVEEGQTVGFGDITDISINLMVCTSCDDPETALEWLDYHFSEDGSILCQYGIEGEGLEYKDGKPNYSDLISNNPEGLSTDNALNAYAINMNMFASNGTTLRAAYDEVQQEALNAWNDKREVTKSSFTNLFTLDADETATVQRYYADISTYVAEQVGKFLIGEADIDENWDTFVETVESMGIDEVIDAYTTAGERYFGRLD